MKGTVPELSIVIPALNEAGNIEACLLALGAIRARGSEVIVVDGGSSDATVSLAGRHADRVVAAERGRASQMNAGASVARGRVLLFLHADTVLPENADTLIEPILRGDAYWGRFDVRIGGRARMLRVVSGMMNLRSRWTGIATGDQAIFVHGKAFHQVGGFPVQPLMEDVEMSRRLRRLGRPLCLKAQVTTSGRRWESGGMWRTIFLMWRLRWRYWRGESPQSLAEAYR